MWIAAIAFAKARGYDRICTGYLSDDEFCTGSIQWVEAMKSLAARHNISVDLPVWINKDEQYPWSIARDKEMASMCFAPKVLEPQCMIGMPTPTPARANEHQLVGYYDRHLEELAKREIEELSQTLKVLKLHVPVYTDSDWKVPDPSTGEF